MSLRLYPHTGLPASEAVDELIEQAVLGATCGFAGVMTSEHHNGFPGYLPNPLQLAGWCLAAMPRGWAAPCPLLLPLRPTALVAEEVAWLAARHPGRVGLGVAAGALPDDFAVMDQTMDDLTVRFSEALARLARMLDGSDPGPLADDPAIAACAQRPVPLLSAAMGFTAVRRAAGLGIGILLDSLSTPARCRELGGAYRAAGGAGPVIAVRRVWIGDPPEDKTREQLDRYRAYASAAAQARWGTDELVAGSDGATVADGLVEFAADAGVDALNLRVHVPGVAPGDVREQVLRLGDEVVEPTTRALRARLTHTSRT